MFPLCAWRATTVLVGCRCECAVSIGRRRRVFEIHSTSPKSDSVLERSDSVELPNSASSALKKGTRRPCGSTDAQGRFATRGPIFVTAKKRFQIACRSTNHREWLRVLDSYGDGSFYRADRLDSTETFPCKWICPLFTIPTCHARRGQIHLRGNSHVEAPLIGPVKRSVPFCSRSV